MKYKKLMILSFLCCMLQAAEFRPRNPMLFSGAIQFPETVKNIPDVRVYCSGNKIKCETDKESKRILFSICEDRSLTEFTLLIADSIFFELQENTVKYLKLNPKHPYKFYVLILKEIVPEIFDTANNRNEQTTYKWIIKEAALPFYNGRIPDNTIIICFDPNFIETVRGGNAVEFPTVFVKNNILNIIGSESKLHEKSAELLLSSLDYD
ncbi:MAG TPA: hypothetical protein VFF04_03960, partial [Candidatus Babeliales bacterium]|nr:hypothetical protein [Candidatus Babeliales bacterium]